jgi:signal transduction histidine kinase
MSLPLRVVVSALLSTVTLLVAGTAWEFWRFGLTEATTLQRLESSVRDQIAGETDRVRTLARRVADESPLIAQALAPDASRGTQASLFARLAELAAAPRGAPGAVTVYSTSPAEPPRAAAWSDGAAGEIAVDLLAGPSTVAVVGGPGGLRLVATHPVETDGHRVAVVAAERPLAAVTREGLPLLPTPFGGVTIVTGPAPDLERRDRIAIDEPRLLVQFTREDIANARVQRQLRIVGFAAWPIVIGLIALTGPVIARQRRADTGARWLRTLLLALALTWAAVLLVALVLWSFLHVPGSETVLVSGVVATVALVSGSLWWWRCPRRGGSVQWTRFLVEHAAAGSALAAAIAAAWFVLVTRIRADTLPAWHSALFPFDARGLLDVWNVLLLQLAIGWGAVGILALVAERWRVATTPGRRALAALCWLAPVVILSFLRPTFRIPLVPALAASLAFTMFAQQGVRLRRRYRRATQSSRLIFGFLALVLPLIATYPLIAAAIDDTTRTVIAERYAPQAARQSEDIRALLARVQHDIDRQPLSEYVEAPAVQPVDSQTAFQVWNATGLRSTRVVSDVELYGPDRSLISRFALNFPEYISRTTTLKWQGAECAWEVFGEVTRFGSSSRAMLHAQRGVCADDGTLRGAVVVHVAPTDYEALPFVASASPYANLLRGYEAQTTRGEGPVGLELVVYGWSLQPLFTTNEAVAWTIDDALFDRIYRDATPFWTRLDANRRGYDVYVQQNRTGIYALGYPQPTFLDHAARLAEIAAVAAILFVVLQLAAVAYMPLVRRAHAPLRVLIAEVRTSFYRKLFLFFVLVAVGPVVVFALAFAAFTQSRFRADIQSEAANVVAVARRVFDQIAVVDQSVQQLPTDDVMVWIRQVIDEDVNLFQGAALVATSQRDLFNSGLLPRRTPAEIYRRIALEHLPSFVAEDQQFLVAATAVPSVGTDAVLSVPLAPRQREVQHEIEELSRGVLVGSVLVVLLAAGLGASLAGRVADPVARLTSATRRIAAGQLDVRITADTADELRRLVDDFNTMTARLVAQRDALARANQLKAWNEMARQVAHEIKNPLTPIQLAAEHLDRVHADRGRPLGDTLDQCVRTILSQVRLLRQIASEFANFASEPTSRPEVIDVAALVHSVVEPYRPGLDGQVAMTVDAEGPALVFADRTLLTRALTNLVENAIQAMPAGGSLQVVVSVQEAAVSIDVRDSGVGMEADTLAHAFEPFFSTKTGGSGLGLANAKRTIEREGGTVGIVSLSGRGTTVSVSLPRMEAPPDGRAASPAPSR